jgi:hypothetical protein
MKRQLTRADYRDAATRLNCEIAAVRAVADVEAPGGGFLSDGRLRVLFEGHQFHARTNGKFAQQAPTLSYPTWTRKHYAKGMDADARGAGELLRLQKAMELDRTEALCSASYGKFQIMGFNWRYCTYPDVHSFYRNMGVDEQAQLEAFCHLLKAQGMVVALRALDWDKFAKLYNGPRFQENDYHGKLARAYQKFLHEDSMTRKP